VAETRDKKDLYSPGFDALVKQWDKCIGVDGGYVEKYVFFYRFDYHMCYVLDQFVAYLLTLPPMREWRHSSTTGHFPPWINNSFSHCIRGWVILRAALEKRKSL
jgi:hypothetical protein